MSYPFTAQLVPKNAALLLSAECRWLQDSWLEWAFHKDALWLWTVGISSTMA